MTLDSIHTNVPAKPTQSDKPNRDISSEQLIYRLISEHSVYLLNLNPFRNAEPANIISDLQDNSVSLNNLFNYNLYLSRGGGTAIRNFDK